MIDVEADYETFVSEEKIVLWKELACLHFANREIGKFYKRLRKYSSKIVTLESGDRVMQLELHSRLSGLCAQMFREMPGLGDEKSGYAYALTCTNLQPRLRRLLRASNPKPLSFLLQKMDRVIGCLDMSPDSTVCNESLIRIKELRGGFAQLAAYRRA